MWCSSLARLHSHVEFFGVGVFHALRTTSNSCVCVWKPLRKHAIFQPWDQVVLAQPIKPKMRRMASTAEHFRALGTTFCMLEGGVSRIRYLRVLARSVTVYVGVFVCPFWIRARRRENWDAPNVDRGPAVLMLQLQVVCKALSRTSCTEGNL